MESQQRSDAVEAAERLEAYLKGSERYFALSGVQVLSVVPRLRATGDGWDVVISVRRDGVEGDREYRFDTSPTAAGSTSAADVHTNLIQWWGGEWGPERFERLPRSAAR